MEVASATAEAWLDRRDYADLPAEAERAIRAAGLAWDDEPRAEAALARAAALAPDHIAVHIAQYKYRFYKHAFDVAAGHAEACVRLALGRLGLPGDWRRIDASDADFGSEDRAVRLALFALKAYGYVLARSGDIAAGRAVLTHLISLDPSDQVEARHLIAVLDRGGRDDEED